jgi:hypothetical protein
MGRFFLEIKKSLCLGLALVLVYVSLPSTAHSQWEELAGAPNPSNIVTTQESATQQAANDENYRFQSTELEKEWIHSLGRVVRQNTPEKMRAVLLELIEINGEKPEKVNMIYDAADPKAGEFQRIILKNVLDGLGIGYEEYPVGDERLREVLKNKLQKIIPGYNFEEGKVEYQRQSAFALVKRDVKEGFTSLGKTLIGRDNVFKNQYGVNTAAGLAVAGSRMTLPMATEFWFSTIQSPIWATLGMVSMATMAGGMLIAKNAITEIVTREEIENLHKEIAGQKVTEAEKRRAEKLYRLKFAAPYMAIAYLSSAFAYTNPGVAVTPTALMQTGLSGLLYIAVEFDFYRERNKLQFLNVYEDPKTGKLKPLGSNMHMTAASFVFGLVQYVIMVNSFIDPSMTTFLGIEMAQRWVYGAYAIAVGYVGWRYLKTFGWLKRKWLEKKGIKVIELNPTHKRELSPCRTFMLSKLAALGY